MPNYCANRWTIYGDKKERILLEKKLMGKCGPLSFQRLKPRPKEQDENWYYWNISEWGTKWDACDVEYKHNKELTEYIFLSAWDTPRQDMIENFMSKFEKLTFTFEYIERGKEFYGRYGTRGPYYRCNMKKEDFKIYNEENGEDVLCEELSHLQTLYDISG